MTLKRSPVVAIGVRRRGVATTGSANASWYAATRVRVEARGTLEQAEELRQVLEEVGEWIGE